ncbi:FecCD family ABC transporter permease [Roseovarius sp. D0-M9]|uniref:FecCD family ABC transporter permease n=1 Tax=Roseovarius sp. D0-M9 TaxID=3127117 RepID=UPI0030105EE6
MTEWRVSAFRGRVALALPVRGLAAMAVLLLTLATLMASSVAFGTIDLDLTETMRALVGTSTGRAAMIAGELRLPRALTALMAGGLLAISGALLQGATRNPLADPALVGISQGAGLAVVAATILAPGLSEVWRMPAAFAGGVGTAGIILLLAERGGAAEPLRFLLIGLGLAAFLAAATTALLTYGGLSDAHAALAWLSGSVRAAGWGDVRLLGMATLAALVICAASARPLAVLGIGDDLAATLGHRPARARAGLLIGAVALASASVAVVGPIAFVGLLAPHAATRLARCGPGMHLTLCWALGGALTCGADLVGRIAFDPVQIPAGLVSALIGAPLFALLMMRVMRKDIE